MTKKYFHEVYEAIKKSKEEESKIPKVSLNQLVARLQLANSFLEKAADRWDYDSIKRSIEDIKFQIKQERKKNHSFHPLNHLTEEEINHALDHYEADYTKASKEYIKVWEELDSLKESFLADIKNKVKRLQEIERISSAAYLIKYHIPNELHHTVKRPLQTGDKTIPSHIRSERINNWIKKGEVL